MVALRRLSEIHEVQRLLVEVWENYVYVYLLDRQGKEYQINSSLFCVSVLTWIQFTSMLDLLYKSYAQQPHNLFHFQCFDCSLDLSCQIGDIAPGLRTLFNLDIPDSARVELQYLSDYAGITGGFGLKGNPVTGYKPLINFSGIIGSDFLSLGTDLAFDISTGTLNKINAGLGFNSDFLSASINLNNMLDTWKVSCCRVMNPPTNTAIAVELKHTFSVNNTAITIGGQHAIFPFTLLKARLSTYGKAGALIQQELWERLVLTIGGEVDFMDIKRIPKLGLSMAFRL